MTKDVVSHSWAVEKRVKKNVAENRKENGEMDEL